MSVEDEIVLGVHADNARAVLKEWTTEGPLHFPRKEDALGRVDLVMTMESMGCIGDKDARIFAPRSMIETMYGFKQPVSYLVVHDGDGRIMQAKRTKKSVDNRIHDKFTIGFGGHISLFDAYNGCEEFDLEYLKAAFEYNAQRELYEELGRNSSDDFDVVCMINDDSNDVGKVHLGLVAFVRLEGAPKASDEHTTISWLDLAGVKEQLGNGVTLENWSRFLAEELVREDGRLPRVLR